MTATELFEQITSEPKWYAGYTTPQHANLLKKRFYSGTMREETIKKMFNHFGYYYIGSWEMKPKVEFNYEVVQAEAKKIAFNFKIPESK